MYEPLVKEIQKKAYFAKHKKVLIAVSGGVDSMNLLHFLYIYRHQLEIEIGIVHVNHKQRAASEEEEAYLKNGQGSTIFRFLCRLFQVFFQKKLRVISGMLFSRKS